MTERTVHDLKSWPPLFEALVDGVKTHEMRKSDRAFRVGDLIRLHEYNPKFGTYTGRKFSMVITYITSAEYPCALSQKGLGEDYCILSVKALER